jgi:hypothetical protein
MKKNKTERFPDFKQVKIPIHLVDSIWIKNDNTEIKIVFATGEILSFQPVDKN